jgi:hypothetical protein
MYFTKSNNNKDEVEEEEDELELGYYSDEKNKIKI